MSDAVAQLLKQGLFAVLFVLACSVWFWREKYHAELQHVLLAQLAALQQLRVEDTEKRITDSDKRIKDSHDWVERMLALHTQDMEALTLSTTAIQSFREVVPELRTAIKDATDEMRRPRR